ncbi:unnamed protein product, partial [Mesorhabditis belari]|uniref:CHK kinase-like domain-containing protein n=1 Tax=Mesorhabditis belari TaxID=2138241 RepID=A0AAF3FPS4_9BILA
MQKAFETKAKFGQHRKAHFTEIHGGFVSQVVFINFDWIGESVEFLPKKAVVKVTTAQELQKVVDQILAKSSDEFSDIGAMINNNELNFYENCKKWGLDEDWITRFYCGRKAGHGISCGYIALELIEGIEARYQYDCVKEPAFLDILKMATNIHSRAILNPDIVNEISRNVPETVYAQLFSAESTQSVLNTILIDEPQKKDQIERINKFAQIYDHLERERAIKMETCPMKLLCHGDFTIANFLWHQVDNVLKPKIALDWQMCHIGNPLTDLARLFAISLSPEDLKNRRDFYLEFYFEELKKEAFPKELPWESKEKFIEAFEKTFPIEMVIVTSMLVPIVDAMLRTCPESKKEKTAKEFRRKLYGILDVCEEFIEKFY